MDGDQTSGGFLQAGLAQIAPALQAVADAGDLSGFVTLVWRRGEVAQVETIGHRDVEAGLPMTRDTLFRIASMTKPVTSIAALMLMEEGKLRLEDPIARWLPVHLEIHVANDVKKVSRPPPFVRSTLDRVIPLLLLSGSVKRRLTPRTLAVCPSSSRASIRPCSGGKCSGILMSQRTASRFRR